MQVNIIFYFVLSILTFASSHRSSKAYTLKIFKESIKSKSVNLTSEGKLILTSDIVEKTPIISISKNTSISDCIFYPYKHVILKYISIYYNETPRAIPHFQIISHTISLSYQLLFYSYLMSIGLDNIRKDMLQSEGIAESNYFVIDLSNEQRRFLEEINQSKTYIKFQKEEKDLMTKLGLENPTYNLAIDIHKFIISKVKEGKGLSKLRTEILSKFINDQDLYLKYYYYIIKHSFPLKKEIYNNINNFNKKEVDDYEIILQSQKTPLNNCFVISPLFPLINLEVNDLQSSKKPEFFGLESQNKELFLTSQSKMTKGIITKKITMPNENAYFDFGYTKNTSFYLKKIFLQFHKSLLGEANRRTVCFNSNCEGMGLEKDLYKGEFILSNMNLNPHIINLFRLVALNETQIVDMKKDIERFDRGEFIDEKNEIKAFLYYYNYLMKSTWKYEFFFDIKNVNKNMRKKEKDLYKIAYNNYNIEIKNIEFLLQGLESMLKKLISSKKL